MPGCCIVSSPFQCWILWPHSVWILQIYDLWIPDHSCCSHSLSLMIFAVHRAPLAHSFTHSTRCFFSARAFWMTMMHRTSEHEGEGEYRAEWNCEALCSELRPHFSHWSMPCRLAAASPIFSTFDAAAFSWGLPPNSCHSQLCPLPYSMTIMTMAWPCHKDMTIPWPCYDHNIGELSQPKHTCKIHLLPTKRVWIKIFSNLQLWNFTVFCAFEKHKILSIIHTNEKL